MLAGPVRTAMCRAAARPNGAIRGPAANVALREPDSRGERRRRAVEVRGLSEAGRGLRRVTGLCGRGTERYGDPDGRCHGAHQHESHDACRPPRHQARLPRPRAQRPLGLRLRGFRTVSKPEEQSGRVGSLRRRGRCGRRRRLRGLAVGNARAGGRLVAAPRVVTPGDPQRQPAMASAGETAAQSLCRAGSQGWIGVAPVERPRAFRGGRRLIGRGRARRASSDVPGQPLRLIPLVLRGSSRARRALVKEATDRRRRRLRPGPIGFPNPSRSP